MNTQTERIFELWNSSNLEDTKLGIILAFKTLKWEEIKNYLMIYSLSDYTYKCSRGRPACSNIFWMYSKENNVRIGIGWNSIYFLNGLGGANGEEI